jgi:hypothetical protein
LLTNAILFGATQLCQLHPAVSADTGLLHLHLLTLDCCTCIC